MCTKNDHSNEPIPSPMCGLCETDITDDEIKLICTRASCGKYICFSCITKMIQTMFSEPRLQYPFKCYFCSEIYDQNFLQDIIINEGQYEKYMANIFPLHWAKDCLEAHEQLVQCPFCSYFEIYTTDTCSIQFFTCQHPLCKKKSCLICLHTVDDDDDNELRHPLQCVALHSSKQLIEEAIELGSQQHCPHCQLTGLKDDGCTHMTCQQCGEVWCYFCGMKEKDCKVEDNAEQSLSAHNENWESYKDRCPMRLTNVHSLDKRWPETDRDCLEYFHRYRTLSCLFNVLTLIGEEKLEETNRYFGIIDTSGYTIQEIKDCQNQIFIDYTIKNEN